MAGLSLLHFREYFNKLEKVIRSICEVNTKLRRLVVATGPSVTPDMIISPRSQWEKYICPCCDELMNDPVLTSCGHRMCYKCFYERKWSIRDDLWCPVRDDDGQEHKMSRHYWSKDETAELMISKLIVKYDKYGIKCGMSVRRYTELVNLSLSRKQERRIIFKVLKKALPSAKRDLSIDEMRPLLYESGVITSEEATELLGIFTGEEKITRLYTEMLPKKGLQGLEQYMRILYDTGWDIPSHMRHHGVLSINLSEELSRIMSGSSVLCRYESEETAREAMVYEQSLPDAMASLGNQQSIDKLLPFMLKKHLVSISEYYWLKGELYPREKMMELYTVILPQKGMKGLEGFMEVLQNVGRNKPKYHHHLDVLKSNLQDLLSHALTCY